ncbi:hypothetical protein V8C86DRAFT_2532241 [Haematococcus lacustris]
MPDDNLQTAPKLTRSVEAEVLESIRNEGHFDTLRKTVLEQLRQHEGLKAGILELLDSSRALQEAQGRPLTPANKKRLLDELRKEKEKELLELASRSVWSLISSSEGVVAQQLQDTVHQALCEVYQQKHEMADQQVAVVGQRQQRP